MERILIPFNFIYQLTKTLPIYWVMSDCRQTPKLGVLFAVFLFYTDYINYLGSDSNDAKTID